MVLIASAATLKPHLDGADGPAGESGCLCGVPFASVAAAGPAAGEPLEEDFPGEELRAACREAAGETREELDGSFTVVSEPPFVVAGNLPPEELAACIAGSVVRPAETMWKSYFEARPKRPIRVFLFAGDASYRRWAKRLFGEEDLPHFGYCRGDGELVMNISTGTGTLVHELTHALIAPDFPDVPAWLNEGLASLHEQCRVGRERIIGLTNWRLPALQAALAKDEVRPLRELITARDFRGELEGLNYAQARYFVMYMQQRGLLRGFYREYRTLHEKEAAARREGEDVPEAPLDVRVVEGLFEREIDEVDADWRKWSAELRFPPSNAAELEGRAFGSGRNDEYTSPSRRDDTGREGAKRMEIRSSAFEAQTRIPVKYTGEGDDVSPPLSWSGAPDGVAGYALICDDPDAPGDEPWVHWVIYNIPAGASGLGENIAKTETLEEPAGAAQGTNSWGTLGYGGPMPPPGHGPHHYHFRLWALPESLDHRPGLSKDELLEAIQDHALAEAELIGVYERK